MKILYQITDEIVRSELEKAIKECVEEGWLVFPSVPDREEFTEDCVQSTIDKFELYETYTPNYEEIVLDMANLYGYGTEV